MKTKTKKKSLPFVETQMTQNLSDVYQDIIGINIDSKDSFETSMDKFYSVMRKHGICQGTWSENGRLCNNPEWNMCFQTFKNHKILAFDIWLALSTPPKDLLAYGENPHKKRHGSNNIKPTSNTVKK